MRLDAAGRTMTVAELRRLLEGVDDDAPVQIVGGKGSTYAIDGGRSFGSHLVELDVEGDDGS